MWLGYYPSSHFNSGALSGGATTIEFGGEVAPANDGSRWAQMGSGAWASAGYTKAAYQRNISYWDPNGHNYWAQLTPVVEAKDCYSFETIKTTNWGSAIYYGGPGGAECPITPTHPFTKRSNIDII